MHAKRWISLLLLLLFLPACSHCTDFTGYSVKKETTRPLAEGVRYTKWVLAPVEGDEADGQRLFVTEVDPSAYPSVSFCAGVRDSHVFSSRAALTDYCAYAWKTRQILAAVNADFFDTSSGGPLGWMMTDGRWIIAGEFPDSPAFGWTPQGPVIGFPRMQMTLTVSRNGEALFTLPIDALNALRGDTPSGSSSPSNAMAARRDNALVLYTADFSSSTHTEDGGVEVVVETAGLLTSCEPLSGTVLSVTHSGDTPLNDGTAVLSACGTAADTLLRIQPGDSVSVAVTVDPAFQNAVAVVGGGRPDGGPLLLENGVPTVLHPESVDDGSYFYNGLHPRTAVALREDGTLLLIVAEGYRRGSKGVSLDEWQRLLLDLGAYTALNLDGGPSSTFVIHSGNRFHLLSDTSGGSRRETRVGNALMLYLQ